MFVVDNGSGAFVDVVGDFIWMSFDEGIEDDEWSSGFDDSHWFLCERIGVILRGGAGSDTEVVFGLIDLSWDEGRGRRWCHHHHGASSLISQEYRLHCAVKPSAVRMRATKRLSVGSCGSR